MNLLNRHRDKHDHHNRSPKLHRRPWDDISSINAGNQWLRDAARSKQRQQSVMDLTVPKMEKVRFGMIGLGQRGGSLFRLCMLAIDGVEITALCDTYEPTVEKHAETIARCNGRCASNLYGVKMKLTKRLLARDDIDAVIIATPWRWHTPMATDAMHAGKHAFVEVPAALNLDECWQP